jgi:protein-S-isoprenylcysteine O-methyltransferase Ste14
VRRFVARSPIKCTEREIAVGRLCGLAAGDALVVLGRLAIFFVFKENSFTSAAIELAPDQKVISTGPYALVRHPMYAGSFVMLLGSAIALGSWSGVLVAVALIAVWVWRIIDEEKFLARHRTAECGGLV